MELLEQVLELGLDLPTANNPCQPLLRVAVLIRPQQHLWRTQRRHSFCMRRQTTIDGITSFSSFLETGETKYPRLKKL